MKKQKERTAYVAPSIEVLEMEVEGSVMGLSGFDSGDGIQVGSMTTPGFDLAEYENAINDLFTTIND